MASPTGVTRSVRKYPYSAYNDIGGFQSSRYEKIESAFGNIPTGSYNAGDLITLPSVPSKTIISATFQPVGGTTVSFLNETDFTAAVTVDSNSGATIGYKIDYIRGGAPGTGNADVLTNVQVQTS